MKYATIDDARAARLERALTERGLLHHVDVAATVHHVSRRDVLGRGQSLTVARARADAFARLSAAGLSSTEIGRLMGRHRTTVQESLRRLRVAA